MKDYYATLGVNKNSSKEDIKKAYKQLAKKYHPDINKEQNSADKFKDINEAYDVLSDDNKKSRYDQFGTTDEHASHEGYSPFSDFEFDINDVFEGFFGGNRRRAKHGVRGDDIAYELKITLEEVATGKKRKINVTRMESCPECNGKGASSANDVKQCTNCNGTGYSKKTIRTPFGYFSQTATCRNCQGEGTIIINTCNECDGIGRIKKNREIEIDIPAGIMNGFKLRIPGGGEAGVKGGPNGDLYLIIYVAEHKLFERDEQDIIIKIPISFAVTALGGEIEVPTLFGIEKLNIPQGTQTNTEFKMKGLGLPSIRGGSKGNERVIVIVETPTKLTSKQKELLMEFDKSYVGKKSIFNRIFN